MSKYLLSMWQAQGRVLWCPKPSSFLCTTLLSITKFPLFYAPSPLPIRKSLLFKGWLSKLAFNFNLFINCNS